MSEREEAARKAHHEAKAQTWKAYKEAAAR